MKPFLANAGTASSLLGKPNVARPGIQLRGSGSASCSGQLRAGNSGTGPAPQRRNLRAASSAAGAGTAVTKEPVDAATVSAPAADAEATAAPVAESATVVAAADQEGGQAAGSGASSSATSEAAAPGTPTANASSDSTAAPPQQDGVLAKFLVSNAWATAIIGRQGVNVKETMEATGAKLQLSARSTFYPGTKLRILMVRGELPSIRSALAAVLARRAALPLQAANPQEVDEIVMLVPVSLCGHVLGPQAATLASLKAATGADIVLQSRDKQGPYVPDRTVRITGTSEQQVEGAMAVLDCLVSGTRYVEVVRGAVPYVTETRTVPNKAVGAIMGKGGASILQMQTVTGVNMSLSQDKDADRRTLTISGMPRSVSIALQLVEEKVKQVVPQWDGGVSQVEGAAAGEAPTA